VPGRLAGALRRDQAAVGLHDQRLASEAPGRQPVDQPVRVFGDERL
jgi:hypothetical protein